MLKAFVPTCGELGVEELQELELDSKAFVRSGGCEARGRLGLPSRPFFERDFIVRNIFVRFCWETDFCEIPLREKF